MNLVKTPTLIKSLFSGLVWSIPTTEKRLYLTFDDGPIPEVTPWVMDVLEQYQAKGTFFCVGENAERHGDLLGELVYRGHDIGNHTQHHLPGWGIDIATYVEDTDRCAEFVPSTLFRPPHGKIRPGQFRALSSRYDIIMWDVLSRDFDHKHTPQQCANHVIQAAGPGSIVVFHDSLKSEKNMRYALEATLDHFSKRGYTFETVSSALYPVASQSSALSTALAV